VIVTRRLTHAILLLTAASIALIAVAPAHAQQPRPVRRPFAADPLTLSADVLEATRLLSVNPEAGIALLRQLNARYPGRDDILARLGYGMQVVGKADSAAVYYKAALDANPLNLDAGKALGSIYFSQGRETDAMRVFNDMLDANAYGVTAYKIVADALRDLGKVDQAIAVLEKGRDRNKKNSALTFEIANLYKQAGDNRKAMDEYFTFVEADPRSYRLVRGRMLDLLRDTGTDEPKLVDYLSSRTSGGGPDGYAARDVLAAHYLERGLLENSLEMALRADEDKSSDGATLLALAEDAMTRADTQPRNARARYLDLGRRASEAFVDGHANAPGIDRAKWTLAEIYVEYGSGVVPAVTAPERAAYLDRAVKAFEDLSKRYPGSELAERAYIERGDVLLRKLKRPDDALAAYKSGAVNSRRLGPEFAARIAEVYIGTDKTNDLDAYLSALSHAANLDLADTGQYYAGVYLATKHEYNAARDTLTGLAEASPSSAYSNDAIALAWVLEEGMTMKSASLDDFVAARKADMIGDTTTVVSRLNTIIAREADDPVRPRALHQLGLVYFDRGNYDAAIGVLRKFLADYPDDDQAPVVQRVIGQVYEKGLGQYDHALHEYEQVLLSYPEYAMLDDMRRDVNRVKSTMEGSTYAP
jgi:tetratricopeptide (TPR) repeat protein